MNLLTCMRSSFGPGLPSNNVPQKMQYRRFSASSMEKIVHPNNSPIQKHFKNPNIFIQNSLDKSTPSSYKNSDPVGNSLLNASNLIPEKIEQESEEKLVEVVENICVKNNYPQVETIVPLSTKSTVNTKEMVAIDSHCEISDSEDSFIVFEDQEGGHPEEKSMNEIEEFEDDTSEDDVASVHSEDSFIVFEDEEGKENRDKSFNSYENFIDTSEDDESSVYSEDDFIDDEKKFNSSKKDDSSFNDDENVEWDRKSMIFFNSNICRRERQESFAESEDSFVVFEDQDSSVTPVGKRKPDNGKKVTFAEGPKFCQVHLMIKWSYAYRTARKGLWEQLARDNTRFKRRACQFGQTLKKFLQPEHRRKIYEERFKNGQE